MKSKRGISARPAPRRAFRRRCPTRSSRRALYGRGVLPASAMTPAKASAKRKGSSTTSKPPKTSAKKAPGARLARPDDSQVIAPRLVGYARVSTDNERAALQLDALRAAGCAVIHEDSASGALRSRPGLDLALADVGAGHTLVVGASIVQAGAWGACSMAAQTLRERGVALRSLTEHIDTGTAAGTMLYAVLGAVAQFERDVIRERTVSGLVAAKRRGERLGRRPGAVARASARGKAHARTR